MGRHRIIDHVGLGLESPFLDSVGGYENGAASEPRLSALAATSPFLEGFAAADLDAADVAAADGEAADLFEAYRPGHAIPRAKVGDRLGERILDLLWEPIRADDTARIRRRLADLRAVLDGVPTGPDACRLLARLERGGDLQRDFDYRLATATRTRLRDSLRARCSALVVKDTDDTAEPVVVPQPKPPKPPKPPQPPVSTDPTRTTRLIFEYVFASRPRRLRKFRHWEVHAKIEVELNVSANATDQEAATLKARWQKGDFKPELELHLVKQLGFDVEIEKDGREINVSLKRDLNLGPLKATPKLKLSGREPFEAEISPRKSFEFDITIASNAFKVSAEPKFIIVLRLNWAQIVKDKGKRFLKDVARRLLGFFGRHIIGRRIRQILAVLGGLVLLKLLFDDDDDGQPAAPGDDDVNGFGEALGFANRTAEAEAQMRRVAAACRRGFATALGDTLGALTEADWQTRLDSFRTVSVPAFVGVPSAPPSDTNSWIGWAHRAGAAQTSTIHLTDDGYVTRFRANELALMFAVAGFHARRLSQADLDEAIRTANHQAAAAGMAAAVMHVRSVIRRETYAFSDEKGVEQQRNGRDAWDGVARLAREAEPDLMKRQRRLARLVSDLLPRLATTPDPEAIEEDLSASPFVDGPAAGWTASANGSAQELPPIEALVPAVSITDVAARLDEYLELANARYTLPDGSEVRALPQFTYGKSPNIPARRRRLVQLLGTGSADRIRYAVYGRARPADIALLTAALIRAGGLDEVAGTGLTGSDLIRQLQRHFGIGIDCAGYVQLAFIFAYTGTDIASARQRKALGLREKIGSEKLASLSATHFRRIALADTQTGDLIVMKPRAADADRAWHTVIIRRHDVSGDRHEFEVDSSWGVDLYGTKAGGVGRRRLVFDASAGTWWDIHPLTGDLVNESTIGPYNGHPIRGCYRPRVRPGSRETIEEESPFGEEESPFGEEESPFGEEESPFGEEESPFGEEESPFGEEEPPFVEEESPFGEEESPFGDGEVIQLEDAGDGDEGEAAPDPAWQDEEREVEVDEEAARARVVRARILWPALGFPAVVTPAPRPSSYTLRDGDATKCVTVVLLSDRPDLSKADAARWLRFVPWDQRDRRHIADGQPGSFSEVDLVVRHDRSSALTVPKRQDAFGTHVHFGGNGNGTHGITVLLSNNVLKLYQAQGLRYLYEVRVTERATAGISSGLYHLFWNSQSAVEDVVSDEMKFLLEHHAARERDELRRRWPAHSAFLMREYEQEYGRLHKTFAPVGGRGRRAEVLHPLFIEPARSAPLRIGHITDTHVDVRSDVYEHNLRTVGMRVAYNNSNRNFLSIYEGARRDADVLFMTGDLIDYGRGHWGTSAPDRLAEDSFYHTDRNWFLFYYLLAAGDNYTRPVYTILGNHDWRLNPYPPFAPGAPDPVELVHDHLSFTRKDQKDVIRAAHGPGHARLLSYDLESDGKFGLVVNNLGTVAAAAAKVLTSQSELDLKGKPTETTIRSVAWYLLTINPFLDYAFTLPGRESVLMLDWAEDETVLFGDVRHGKLFDLVKLDSRAPRPSRCLTPLQQTLVREFVAGPSRAKIVGLHAPVIGPPGDWYDGHMLAGRKTYANTRTARGPVTYATKKPDGTIEQWNGHPTFAIRPDAYNYGAEASHGAVEKWRSELIRLLANSRHRVRLVLTGHIHRNGLYVVHVAPKSAGKLLAGRWLARGVITQSVRGAKPPKVGLTPEAKNGPLYVNTTSAGPRGAMKQRTPTQAEQERGGLTADPGYAHIVLDRGGTIRDVQFRSIAPASVTAPTRPAPARELLVAAGV